LKKPAIIFKSPVAKNNDRFGRNLSDRIAERSEKQNVGIRITPHRPFDFQFRQKEIQAAAPVGGTPSAAQHPFHERIP
jgi:hypothetical protein